MDRRLKQRLIGALVLVSLGVIFIPMILDGPGNGPVIEGTNIPQRPEGGFASGVPPLPPEPAPPPAMPEPQPEAGAPPPGPPAPVPGAPALPPAEVAEPQRATVPEPLPEEPAVPAAAAPIAAEESAPAVEPPPAPRSPAPPPKPKPPAPAAPATVVSKPPPTVPPKPAPVAEPSPPPPAPVPRVPETATSGAGGGTGWAVQMGSFSSNENAIVLRDKLRAHGFSAFVELAYGRNDRMVRVFVGPQLQRADAEAVAARLQSALALKGIVVSYP